MAENDPTQPDTPNIVERAVEFVHDQFTHPASTVSSTAETASSEVRIPPPAISGNTFTGNTITPVAAFVPAVTPAVDARVPNGVVMRGRDDNDVLTGHFATVIAGEHEGRYGVYAKTVETGPDGYPTVVLLKTRDDRDEDLVVNYADIRPAESGGR